MCVGLRGTPPCGEARSDASSQTSCDGRCQGREGMKSRVPRIIKCSLLLLVVPLVLERTFTGRDATTHEFQQAEQRASRARSRLRRSAAFCLLATPSWEKRRRLMLEFHNII